MKIKLFNLQMFIILISLLIGCNVNTQSDKLSQENTKTITSVPESSTRVPEPSSEVLFPPPDRRQEYMYKYLVAEIAMQRGQYDLAAQYFIDLAKEAHDSRFAERATQIALFVNDYTLALKTTQSWTQIEPTNFKARQLLSNLLLHLGRIDEALTQLEMVLNTFKEDMDKRLQILTMLVDQPSNPTHILELIRKLLTKRPNDVSVLVIYAHLLITDGKLERALRIVNQLLDLDPNHEQGVLLYAHVLANQDKLEHALLWLKQKLHDKPANEEWRLLYARLLVQNEKFTEAIEQFQQLLQKKPDDPELIHTLGLLALRTEQLPAAKNYFGQLLNDEETVDKARYYFGQIAEKEELLDEALRWYRAVTSGDFYLSAQISVASILFEQGHIDEGRKHLHSIASGLDEKESLTLIQAEANLLMEQERFPEAMAVYNKALEKRPQNTDLLYTRAMLAEKMGQLDLLEKDLRYILTLEPNNIEALNALGYTLADQTQRYQEAYQLIQQALTVSTEESFHILDSMGWVLYRLGQYQEAIVHLRKAQAKQNDPEVAAHLGEVLWVSGQQEEAKAVWMKAAEDFPDDKQLQETMQKFLKD